MSLGSSHFSHLSSQPRSLFQSRIFWMMSPGYLSLLSIFLLFSLPLHSSKHTSHCLASSCCRRPLRCLSCQEDEECDALTFQEQNVPSKLGSQSCHRVQGLHSPMLGQTLREQNWGSAMGVTASESLSALPLELKEELEVQEALLGAAGRGKLPLYWVAMLCVPTLGTAKVGDSNRPSVLHGAGTQAKGVSLISPVLHTPPATPVLFLGNTEVLYVSTQHFRTSCAGRLGAPSWAHFSPPP